MEFEHQAITSTEHRFVVNASAADVSDAFGVAARKLRSRVVIPGYRRGKVPLTLIKSKYLTQLREDAFSQLTQRFLTQDFPLSNAKAAGPTKSDANLADFTEGLPFQFSLQMETVPQIELGDSYRGISLVRFHLPWQEQHTDQVITRIRRSQAMTHDGALAENSRKFPTQLLNAAEFRVVGPGDSPAVGETEATERDLQRTVIFDLDPALSSAEFVAMFLGHAAGKTLNIVTTVGQAGVFAPVLGAEAGAAAETQLSCEVEITWVGQLTVPQLSDDWAMANKEAVTTMDQWREWIRDRALARNKEREEDLLRQHAAEELRRIYPIDIPPSWLATQIEHMICQQFERLEANLPQRERQNILASILGDDSVRESFRVEAEKLLQASFILLAIAEKESLNLSQSPEQAAMDWVIERAKISVEPAPGA